MSLQPGIEGAIVKMKRWRRWREVREGEYETTAFDRRQKAMCRLQRISKLASRRSSRQIASRLQDNGQAKAMDCAT